MYRIARHVALILAAAGCVLVDSVAGTSAAPQPDPPGRWGWPLAPRPDVVEPFVPPTHPYGPGHRGADLAGTVGQPVLAVDDGRVSFAGQVAGRGVVVVDHGRLRTTYEPVLVAVRRGDQVGAGEVLGTLTLAGGHCLPLACLHLGARDGETYVDPLARLGTGPVRLLPLDGSAPVPCCGVAQLGSPLTPVDALARRPPATAPR